MIDPWPECQPEKKECQQEWLGGLLSGLGNLLSKMKNHFKCSYMLCQLGHIAYGVHLCNNILIFEGKSETGSACHPVLGTGRPEYQLK